MLSPIMFFIGLGPLTNWRAANLAVQYCPLHMCPLVDYGNIKDCYYSNMVNIEEYKYK